MCLPASADRPFPEPKGPVNDFANVIPPAYEQKIRAITLEVLQKTDISVVVVTMPDIEGYEYNEYATLLYEKWGIGKKGEDKGVLIFVTVKERKMRIETGYGVEGILPDGLCGEIRDQYMVPFLKENKYGEGLLNGTIAVAQVIEKAEARKRFDEFVKKYGVKEWPSKDALFANPFVYEGRTIAIVSSFDTMLSPTQGVLEVGGDPVIVSKIPKGLFSSKAKVVIAGRVLGKKEIKLPVLGTVLVPHLKFVGVHFCKDWRCSGIIAKD